jgi:hypothetical protein
MEAGKIKTHLGGAAATCQPFGLTWVIERLLQTLVGRKALVMDR